jgi:hypothetical protein
MYLTSEAAELRHDRTAARSTRRNLAVEVLVVLWAIAVATYSQYAALTNHYVVNGDTPAAISWMQQFRDPTLFNNDLLSDIAAQIQGQPGFVLFYRAFAVFIDPLLLSRFVPIVLLAAFALYTYKFVHRFSTQYAAVLTAGLAIVAPTYLEIMSGGHQRAFALPLLMAFLYYVAISAWRRACAALALQAVFYPMAFLVCVPTYAMALLGLPSRRGWAAAPRHAIVWFVAVVAVCVTLLSIANVFAPDPKIGRIVTRVEMEGRPEFYAAGRTRVLPSEGLRRDMTDQLIALSRALSLGYPHTLLRLTAGLNRAFIMAPLALAMFLASLFIGRALRRRVVVIPPVLIYLLAAGVVMYVLADLVLFRLYLPNRYLVYTVQISGLLIVGLAAGHLVELIRAAQVRRVVQVVLLALIALRVDLTRDIGLADQSAGRPLFEFLETLPPTVLIASHPDAADYIPTFARRKVFLNFELSYPFYDVYWQTITERTTAFFDAYYAGTRADAYEFCVKHRIDYLVVRMRDFQQDYLSTHRIYFEPFEQHVRARIAVTPHHALAGIRPEEMLFRDGDTFVISTDILRADQPERTSFGSGVLLEPAYSLAERGDGRILGLKQPLSREEE